MMRLLTALLAALWTSSATAHVVSAEWDGATPAQRDWAKRARSKQGVPCCDVADGHRTDYDIRADGYWIPNPEKPDAPWLHVPPESVVYNAGNPVGEAIVWYVPMRSANGADFFIRCFVPGGGA